MGYAIQSSGSWRAVTSDMQLADGETYSDVQPEALPIVFNTSISPSQQIILSDGEDKAIITITGEPLALVEYTVNESPQSITLDGNGRETIELTCDTPNTTLLVQVGAVKAVVLAVEVPS